MNRIVPTSSSEITPVEGAPMPFVLTITQLATTLQVPVKTIYYWVGRNEIPYIKVGRHLRFYPAQVLEAFAQKTADARPSCIRGSGLVSMHRSSEKRASRRSLAIRDRNLAETEKE